MIDIYVIHCTAKLLYETLVILRHFIISKNLSLIFQYNFFLQIYVFYWFLRFYLCLMRLEPKLKISIVRYLYIREDLFKYSQEFKYIYRILY